MGDEEFDDWCDRCFAVEAEVQRLLERLKVAEAAEQKLAKLREHEFMLAEAEAVIILAQHELGVEHPVWRTLDGYDGSGDAIAEVKRLCDGGILGFPFTMTRGSGL